MYALYIGNGLLVSICILFTSNGSESIKWHLKSKTVVFGEDVYLNCVGSKCQPDTIKKWIGGIGYKLLCYDGYSANSAKYAILVNDSGADFGLMIKQFAVKDTNCKYTCSCGLHQHTETLDLKGVDYIYPPQKHYNSTMENEGKYKIDIQLDVYPFPTCVIIYEGIGIPVKITKHSFKRDNLQLYNVSIIYNMDLRRYICKGELLLTCNFGKRNYTLIHQSIDFCKAPDKMDTNYNFLIALSALAASVLVVMLICLTRYKCTRDLGHSTETVNVPLNPTTI